MRDNGLDPALTDKEWSESDHPRDDDGKFGDGGGGDKKGDKKPSAKKKRLLAERDKLTKTIADLDKRPGGQLTAMSARNTLAALDKKIANAKETESPLTVYKQADGSYRWLVVSSNAYRDNDGQIVSLKAQDADIARMDATHDYGPLRWWHVPGVDIGTCDFAALQGRMRVESGTFATKEIGASVAEHAGELAVSLGFTHGLDQPDAEGVFHHINVFERSLLPKGKAANPYTFVSVKELNDMASLKEKLAEAVKTVFGGDEAQAKAYMAVVDAHQKELDDAHVTHKGEGTDAEGTTEQPQAEQPEQAEAEAEVSEVAEAKEITIVVGGVTYKAMPMPMDEEDDEEAEDEEEDTETEEKDKAKKEAATTKAGGKSGKAELDAMFAAMHDDGSYDEGALSGKPGTSAGGKKVPNRQRTSFRKGKKKKELGDDLAASDLTADELSAMFTAAVKEQLGPVFAALKEAQAGQVALKEQQATTLKGLEDRLAVLEGGQPKFSMFGYRASKEGDAPRKELKESKPAQDEAASSFLNWAVNGSNGAAK